MVLLIDEGDAGGAEATEAYWAELYYFGSGAGERGADIVAVLGQQFWSGNSLGGGSGNYLAVFSEHGN